MAPGHFFVIIAVRCCTQAPALEYAVA